MDTRTWYRIVKKILLVALAVTPLIFSPFSGIETEFAKLTWFTVIGSFALLFVVGKMAKTRSVSLSFSPAIVGWGILALGAFLSLLIATNNKIEALLSPVGAVPLLIGCCLLLFFLPLLTKKDQQFFTNTLLTVTGILAVVTIYQHIGVNRTVFPALVRFHDPLWSPIGSPLAALWFFSFMIPLFFRVGFRAHLNQNMSESEREKHTENETAVALSGTGIILTLIAIILTLIRLLPNLSLFMLPVSTGIQTITALFSSPTRMFFGVGAENFFPLFTEIRTVSFNLLPFWTTGFQENSTLLLHVGSVFGIIGIIGFITLIVTTIQTISLSRFSTIWAIVFLFLFLIAPPSVIVYITFISFIFIVRHKEDSVSTSQDPILRYALTVIIPILCIILLYGIGRAFTGEYHFARSSLEGEAGNGSATFLSQQRAIAHNPFMSRYHIGMSKTATALTSALISSADTDANGLPKLSLDDQTTVEKMVTEAIRQGKLAVTLAPANVVAWATLAETYQRLVGVATDADTWAIASYQKAISLDPTNPILRRDFGMLYTTLGRYDEAHQAFITAVQLKPNYANAFYSMAHMFVKKGDIPNAQKALEETLILVKNDEKASDQVLQDLKGISTGTIPQITPTPGISDDRPALIP